IRYWLEQELRGYDSAELAAVEAAHRDAHPENASQYPLVGLLRPETVQVPLDARTKRSVLETLLEVAGRTWHVWEPALLLQATLDREEVLSTGFENGVAVPHPRNPLPQALGESIIAYGRTTTGIPFGAPQRALSDMFFLVLCRDAKLHLLALARLGRLLHVPGFLDDLRAAPDSATSYAVIQNADRKLSQE